ncbi:DUF6215 domain-containing protein [Streptomyces mirabilis]|uniref:DUF6215 domain-containing protein n=2 Tax=Streptomyces mirabilis TaxID=68239 RepID=UPI0033A5EFF3
MSHRGLETRGAEHAYRRVSPHSWGQASAAVVVGGLRAGLLVLQGVSERNSGDRHPATCTSSKATPATEDPGASKHVSGAQLCTALNRSDLPALLGTPAEQAETAGGNESSVKLAGGTEIATPEATVTLKTYSVKISASYDHLPIAQMADLLNTAQKRTVLGHPAVLHSDRTIAIWRQDSVVPDDAALLSVAEKVLPTIPGWGNG